MHIKLLIALSYLFFAAPDEKSEKDVELSVVISNVLKSDAVLVGIKRENVKDTKPEKTDGEEDESEGSEDAAKTNATITDSGKLENVSGIANATVLGGSEQLQPVDGRNSSNTTDVIVEKPVNGSNVTHPDPLGTPPEGENVEEAKSEKADVEKEIERSEDSKDLDTAKTNATITDSGKLENTTGTANDTILEGSEPLQPTEGKISNDTTVIVGEVPLNTTAANVTNVSDMEQTTLPASISTNTETSNGTISDNVTVNSTHGSDQTTATSVEATLLTDVTSPNDTLLATTPGLDETLHNDTRMNVNIDAIHPVNMSNLPIFISPGTRGETQLVFTNSSYSTPQNHSALRPGDSPGDARLELATGIPDFSISTVDNTSQINASVTESAIRSDGNSTQIPSFDVDTNKSLPESNQPSAATPSTVEMTIPSTSEVQQTNLVNLTTTTDSSVVIVTAVNADELEVANDQKNDDDEVAKEVVTVQAVPHDIYPNGANKTPPPVRTTTTTTPPTTTTTSTTTTTPPTTTTTSTTTTTTTTTTTPTPTTSTESPKGTDGASETEMNLENVEPSGIDFGTIIDTSSDLGSMGGITVTHSGNSSIFTTESTSTSVASTEATTVSSTTVKVNTGEGIEEHLNKETEEVLSVVKMTCAKGLLIVFLQCFLNINFNFFSFTDLIYFIYIVAFYSEFRSLNSQLHINFFFLNLDTSFPLLVIYMKMVVILKNTQALIGFSFGCR